ncbi:MAG: zinc-ribbon domain-containing protein [Polyangiaceae bacterium]
MKVQCGHCPAKYAIADERIHGKKVRIRCKRCGSAIVVDGKIDPPQVTTEGAPQGASDSLPPSSPRPEAKTILGGLEAPTHLFDKKPPQSPLPRLQPAGMPAAGRGFTEPPPAFDGKASWRVALTENELRWMTTSEVLEAYRAGVVKPETFVLGEGMSHWQTLLEVDELASALGYQAASPALNGKRDEPSVPPPRKPSTSKRPALRDPEDSESLNAKMTKLGLGLDLKPRSPSPLESDIEASPGRGKAPARLDESFLTLPFTDAEAIDSLPPPAQRVKAPELQPPTPLPERVEPPQAPLPTFTAAQPLPLVSQPLATPPELQPLPESLQQAELPTLGSAKATSSGSLWPWLLAVVVVAAVVAAAVVFTH